MTIDEYAAWAATMPQPSFGSQAERLAYPALGLAGEAGEVADTVRRSMREGNLERGSPGVRTGRPNLSLDLHGYRAGAFALRSPRPKPGQHKGAARSKITLPFRCGP